jgi:hypothetical protein
VRFRFEPAIVSYKWGPDLSPPSSSCRWSSSRYRPHGRPTPCRCHIVEAVTTPWKPTPWSKWRRAGDGGAWVLEVPCGTSLRSTCSRALSKLWPQIHALLRWSPVKKIKKLRLRERRTRDWRTREREERDKGYER